jgi:hypothetical protein
MLVVRRYTRWDALLEQLCTLSGSFVYGGLDVSCVALMVLCCTARDDGVSYEFSRVLVVWMAH